VVAAADQEDIMANTVLVAYATRYGSTQEVAEAIAATLRNRGLQATLQAARDAASLDGYDAVVLGAPLYIGSLLKDARRFLSQHGQALAQRPIAAFALGPTFPEDDLQAARAQLDQELAKFPGLSPVAAELFGGRFDPAVLRFPDSLLTKLPASPLHAKPASDMRDWDAIGAWADRLADLWGAARQ
jgi:menaquinone-dependent protoporphyrinogen oxidase